MTHSRHNSRIRRRRKKRLFIAQDGRCFWCKKRMTIGGPRRTSATFDELVPQARGGTQQWSNVVLACVDCNNSRGDRLAPQWAMIAVANRPVPPLLSEVAP